MKNLEKTGQASRKIRAARMGISGCSYPGVHEMEGLKRAQEMRIDEFSTNEFEKLSRTMQEVISQVQELQK